MPLVSNSTYRRPFYLLNNHMETIVPSIWRKVSFNPMQRRRLEIPDGDFLDIDIACQSSNTVAILSHGLEGSSRRPYILGMAKFLFAQGMDIIAWNYRSCSGEMNRTLRLYHHGVTDDYQHIIDFAINQNYSKIVLVGFSMGGSTTLKWLGETGNKVPEVIKAAVVFSVPCNLWDSAVTLRKKDNALYHKRFLKKLKQKVKLKAEQFPEEIDISNLESVQDFETFDERFTAPLHGFKNAKDFYETSTSDRVYDQIQKPALIVNALNDPMLGQKCYPLDICKKHDYLFLEMPKTGGHVGFSGTFNPVFFSETRTYSFFESYL